MELRGSILIQGQPELSPLASLPTTIRTCLHLPPSVLPVWGGAPFQSCPQDTQAQEPAAPLGTAQPHCEPPEPDPALPGPLLLRFTVTI